MSKVINKNERYLNITNDIIKNIGGKENIKGVAHCATRLRIVLDDDSKINMKALDEIDMAKGVFMVGDQLQIIFGAGLVNEVYEIFAQYTNMQNMSLSDIKTK